VRKNKTNNKQIKSKHQINEFKENMIKDKVYGIESCNVGITEEEVAMKFYRRVCLCEILLPEEEDNTRWRALWTQKG